MDDVKDAMTAPAFFPRHAHEILSRNLELSCEKIDVTQ